jgi:hypothetical protein
MSKKNGPEPFFRPRKNRWYVQLGTRQINLGPDEQQARVRWHQLMSGAVPAAPAQHAAPTTGPLAYAVVDLFVGWCKIHRPGRTTEWYQTHLESFLNSLPDRWSLGVDQLKPFHVVNWADAQPEPRAACGWSGVVVHPVRSPRGVGIGHVVELRAVAFTGWCW